MKKLLALVALVLSVLISTGCSQTGGTAAIVDGHKILETKVDAVVNALQESDPARYDALKLRHDVVNGFIIGRLGDSLEARTGKHAAEADISRELANAQVENQAKPVQEWLRGIARARVIARQTDEATFTDILRSAKVDLNPRYGRWLANEGTVQPENMSLSEPFGGR